MKTVELLDEKHIVELVDSLREKKIGLSCIKFKYNYHNNEMLPKSVGVRGVIEDNDYFSNIEENLIYANLCWFTPFGKDIKANFDVHMPVNPDGSIEHHNIGVVVKMDLPSHLTSRQYDKFVYPVFRKLVPFRQFVTNVEFKGHDHHVKFIMFHLSLNGKLVTPILNKQGNVNVQILSQWISTLDFVSKLNEDNYSFEENLPVINGRMSAASFETTLGFRYKP